MTKEQLDEIILGLEQGLSEVEMKNYFQLTAKEMGLYKRAYIAGKFEKNLRGESNPTFDCM